MAKVTLIITDKPHPDDDGNPQINMRVEAESTHNFPPPPNLATPAEKAALSAIATIMEKSVTYHVNSITTTPRPTDPHPN